MGKGRMGGVMAIEGDRGMGDYIETGIWVNAEVRSEVLINILMGNRRLDDGGVIMKNKEIGGGGCYLGVFGRGFI